MFASALGSIACLRDIGAPPLVEAEPNWAMPPGLLTRVQDLESRLQQVSEKCSRVDDENGSLREWVRELESSLKSTQTSFVAFKELHAEVKSLRSHVCGSVDPVRGGASFESQARPPLGCPLGSAAASHVSFANGHDLAEAEINNEGAGPKRFVHGRKATAFVSKGSLAGAVSFATSPDEVDDEEDEEDSAGPKRTAHWRKSTAFVPRGGLGAEVSFASSPDEVDDEEDEEDSAGPKRTAHGRKSTAFVPRGGLGAEVSFASSPGEVDDEEDEEDSAGPKRTAHWRKATAFVPRGGLGAEVSFGGTAGEPDGEGEDDGDEAAGPKRLVHGRKQTAFVPKGALGGGANLANGSPDERNDLEDSPKSPIRKGRVQFRSNDSVNLFANCEDDSVAGSVSQAPSRPSRERVPTAFIDMQAATATAKDIGGDCVRFADESDKSDGEQGGPSDIDSPKPQVRPVRTRVPTAFCKAT
ncbi:unnamed protein product, partial [Polarella glacialis]